MSSEKLKVAILTISDSIFFGKNNTQDKSGLKIEEVLKSNEKFQNCEIIRKLVPDEIEQIEKAFIDWINENIPLIISTGNFSFSF